MLWLTPSHSSKTSKSNGWEWADIAYTFISTILGFRPFNNIKVCYLNAVFSNGYNYPHLILTDGGGGNWTDGGETVGWN